MGFLEKSFKKMGYTGSILYAIYLTQMRNVLTDSPYRLKKYSSTEKSEILDGGEYFDSKIKKNTPL